LDFFQEKNAKTIKSRKNEKRKQKKNVFQRTLFSMFFNRKRNEKKDFKKMKNKDKIFFFLTTSKNFRVGSNNFF
jgi:hypothetical protein